MCESRGQRRVLGLAIVQRFGLVWRSVSYRLEDPAVVEPIDLLECCELHCFKAPPRTAESNHLDLVQPDNGLGQALGVADGQILRASVTVVDQGIVRVQHAGVQGLLKRVERQVGAKRVRHPPPDDASGIGVHDERDADDPCPGRDVRDVRAPQGAWAWGPGTPG